jgi:hypothetical protein
MPDWTDLKDEIAVSWKVSWNDDPLPLSVPERLLDEDPLQLPVVVVVEEEQAAARTAVAARATPTVVARLIRRSCMSYASFPGR